MLSHNLIRTNSYDLNWTIMYLFCGAGLEVVIRTNSYELYTL